jgi:hypothetical protein
MARIQCAACNDLFIPRRNVPNQKYCSKPECQRERRRQRRKLKEDPDCRANQAAAQQRWGDRNPGYWNCYRRSHSQYTERKRQQQRQRNRRRATAVTGPSPPDIAKRDAYPLKSELTSSTYRLVPVSEGAIAKRDAYLVEMHGLSGG